MVEMGGGFRSNRHGIRYHVLVSLTQGPGRIRHIRAVATGIFAHCPDLECAPDLKFPIREELQSGDEFSCRL
jgi:hypothetical protein